MAEGTAARHGEAPILFPGIVICCVLLIAIFAIYPASVAFTHVSNDFGEGWNAYWAQAIQTRQPLYSASRIFTANNYPPVSFYANAALGSIIGDDIFAGRLIASASLLGVAVLIMRIVALLGAPARWAWLSAGIFLIYNLAFLRQMVAVDNPQWLGEAIGLAGILPLVRRPLATLRPHGIALASATMVIAGLVKHNQIALPLAVTAWLLLFDRRALLVWCGSCACFVTGACAMLHALYGKAVLIELVQFQRTMSLSTFESGLVKLADFVPLVAVAALSLRWQRANPRMVLLCLYALFGVLSGLLQRLGDGVFINVYDDALIGLVTVCGALLGLAASGEHPVPLGQGGRAALLIGLLVPVWIATPKRIQETVVDVRDLGRQQAIWASMIAEVRNARGPVRCEIPAVCYWAGKPLTVDFFAYGQKLKLGADPMPLYRFLASRRAAVIVIDRNLDTPPEGRRLPPPFPALIEQNYRVARLAQNHVATMVPRG